MAEPLGEPEEFVSLPSHLNNTEHSSPPFGSSCLLIDKVPLTRKGLDISNALCHYADLPYPSDVKVLPDTRSCVTPPLNNYALATVSNTTTGIPSSVVLQSGLPPSPLTLMFTEQAAAEFTINPNIITPQFGDHLLEEGRQLSLEISFPKNDTISISGTCNQIYKFREYLTSLLTRNILTPTATQTIVVPIEEPVTPNKEEEGNKNFTGLSRDVLLLMSRVGTFNGMTFYPDEGRVEILSSTEEEQEQCITKFQQSYQDITKHRQIKSGDIQVPGSFPAEDLVLLFHEFNEKYNQCHFSHDEKKQMIRIISMSSRQFDQAKKLITDRLQGGVGVKPKPSTTPSEGGYKLSTKVGSSVTLELHGGRKIIVKRGNIVDEQVDVIVNAANSQLHHAAGVAGALDKASNYELGRVSTAHIRKYGSVPVGGAATTKAGGKLKCKHVIHAVGPMSSQHVSETLCSELIFQAITNSLIEAEKVKANSISFPALSTGIFAVKKTLAADAIFQALTKYHYTSKLKDIRIIILDEPTFKCFAQHLIDLKTTPPPNPSPPTPATTTTGLLPPTTTTDDVITSQPTNIHYPLLPSTYNNPLAITGSSTNTSGSGFFAQPKLHYTSAGRGHQLMSAGRGQQLISAGRGHTTGQGTDGVGKLHHQLSDPTGMNSSQEEEDNKFKTPPATPPKTPPPKDETDTGCPICLNNIVTDPVSTPCCKQVYCRSCIDTALIHSSYCPTCKTALRPVQGNQPAGTMEYETSPMSLPGYDKYDSIVITYKLPNGTQGPEHPKPGTRYHGTTRTAYLPNNTEGQQVLMLLKRAFDARLTFTIGTSHTSGVPNTVVWNDIHHKTTIRGQPFGYPDATYLERVKEELKAKGIE